MILLLKIKDINSCMKNYRLGIHDKQLFYVNNGNLNKVIYTGKDKLINSKCKIDNCDQKKWDKCKKYMNPYEYIYTSSNTRKNICSVSPVSRSYFKLHEMIVDLKLINFKENNTFICIAEGPGGFIHCLHDQFISNKKTFLNLHAITLISSDPTIPYWNNNIVRDPKNKLCEGSDGTGSIYVLKNVEMFIDTIKNDKNFCGLITADGGFDFSDDYNSQEDSSYQLLLSEIYIALNVQDLNGSFIIKVFDLFNYQTVQLIYLLYCSYSYIEIYKPTTSRLSNSEKYIVCSGFQGVSKEILENIKENFNTPEKINYDVPKSFIDDINNYNDIFVKGQIDTIENILKNIENYKEMPTRSQIKDAIKWCELYHLPINRNCIYL